MASKDGSKTELALTDLAGAFRGHYWPTDQELEVLWSEGVLVLDASVLLSFYRYSQSTQDALLQVLARFAGRIFVPHQAAMEFQHNRLNVIRQQIETYEVIESELRKSMEHLRQRAGQLRRHPILEADEVLARVNRFEDDLRDYIGGRRHEHPNRDSTSATLMLDQTRQRIADAIGDAVGPPYPSQRQQEIEAEAARRFEKQVPPGFRDASAKSDLRQYGDVVFWYQTLEFAAQVRKPILLVTDDEKDDWWWRFGGKTLGPRPELVVEIHSASGHQMFMYTSRSFLENARHFLSEMVSDDAIDEVKVVAHELRTQMATEQLQCPHCEWSPIAVEIGVPPGSSAIARCPNCEHRFHAHRRGGGDVLTSAGSLGRRVVVPCPECRDEVWVDFFGTEGGSKQRVCLSCFANVEIEAAGAATVAGYSNVVDSEVLDDRHLLCPRCEAQHTTFSHRDGSVFAFCHASDPRLLLRGRL